MWLIFILLAISVCLGLVVINLLNKNEKLEEYMLNQETRLEEYDVFIKNILTQIEESNERLKEIDIKGSYSSDDEIGWFFSQLKQMQEILNNFTTNGNEKN